MKINNLTHQFIIEGSGPIALILGDELHSLDEFRKMTGLDTLLSNFTRVYPLPIGRNWMPFGRPNKFDDDFLGSFKPSIIIGFGIGADRASFLNFKCPAFFHSPRQWGGPYRGSYLVVTGDKNIFGPKPPREPYHILTDVGYFWEDKANHILSEFISEQIKISVSVPSRSN